MILRGRRKEAPGLPRLAAQAVRQHERRIAEPAARLFCCGTQQPHAADHMPAGVFQHLGRLLPEQGLQRGIRQQACLPGGLQRLSARRGIRHGGAGADDVRPVAQHVRQQDGHDARRGAVLRKAAALHGGKTLAHGVHRRDIRPAAQEPLRDRPQARLRHERQLEQGAGSAGQQHEDRVLRRQPLRERQRTARRSKGPRIRHGVPGLRQLKRRERPAEMAVLGNDNPPPDGHAGTGGPCHGPRRLSRRKEHDPARQPLRCQRLPHEPARLRGRNGLAQDCLRILAHRLHAYHPLFLPV